MYNWYKYNHFIGSFYSKFVNFFKLDNFTEVISDLNTLNIHNIRRIQTSAEIAKADYI